MCLWSGDHDDRTPTSDSAPMTTSGGASTTNSRDAFTATENNLTPAPLARMVFAVLNYQPISVSGVVVAGGGPTGPAGVREKRGAGAACSTPWTVITVERACKWSAAAASLQVNTGVTHASVPVKACVHSSRVRLANRSAKASYIRWYEPMSS